jgi:hypothetical protein
MTWDTPGSCVGRAGHPPRQAAACLAWAAAAWLVVEPLPGYPLGGETKVLQPPDDKDLDRQLIVDLRRMLTNAGLEPS